MTETLKRDKVPTSPTNELNDVNNSGQPNVTFLSNINVIQRDIQSPPKYDGNSDSYDFILRFRQICNNNNWREDAAKIDSLCNCFQDGALYWWLTYSSTQNLNSTQPQYEEIEQAFLRAFPSRFNSVFRSEQLARDYAQKPGENPITYIYTKQYYLLTFEPQMTESTQIRNIISQLQPALLQRCNLSQPKTISELVEAVQKIQDGAIMLWNRIQNETTYISNQPTYSDLRVSENQTDNRKKNEQQSKPQTTQTQDISVIPVMTSPSTSRYTPRASGWKHKPGNHYRERRRCYLCQSTRHPARHCRNAPQSQWNSSTPGQTYNMQGNRQYGQNHSNRSQSWQTNYQRHRNYGQSHSTYSYTPD